MRLIRSVSVRTRLLAALLLVSVIPAVLVGVFANKVYARLVTGEFSAIAVQAIADLDAELTSELRRYAQFIDQVSINDEVQRALGERRGDVALRRAVENILIRGGHFRGMWVLDAYGESLYRDGFIRLIEDELPELLAGADSASPSDSLYYLRGDNGNITLGRKIFRFSLGLEHIGYIFAVIDSALPNEKISSKVLFDGGSVMLLAADGMVLAGNETLPGTPLNDTVLYQELLEAEQLDRNSFTYTSAVDGVPNFVAFSLNKQYDTYVLTAVPLSALNEGTGQIGRQTVLLVILTTLLCVALSLLIYNSIAVPIRRIVAKCLAPSECGAGDVNPDELGFLSRAIDQYMTDLEAMTQMRIADQRRKRELELESLQYQINPHFLFNTLGTLKWVAVINNAPSVVSEGLTSLAQLFRSVLGKDEMIPLREELDNLTHYFTIQKIRYADCFQVENQIDETLLDSRVPRFILQPLAENAVLHGSEGGGRQIVITVHCQRIQEGVFLEIRDNGSGFDQKNMKNKPDARFSGVGLSNVDERLKLCFGEEYGLDIYSVPGEGTICRVIIPDTREEDVDV